MEENRKCKCKISVTDKDEQQMRYHKLSSVISAMNKVCSNQDEYIEICMKIVSSICIGAGLSIMDMKELYEGFLRQYQYALEDARRASLAEEEQK